MNPNFDPNLNPNPLTVATAMESNSSSIPAGAHSPPNGNNIDVNDGGAREFLAQQKWPPGLQETFINNVYKIAYRVFICDDSGSMASTDGNRLLDTNGHKQ